MTSFYFSLMCKSHWDPPCSMENWALYSLTGGFPGCTSGKEPTYECRRLKKHGFDPWSGRYPGGGHSNPIQYSCLENPMDRGAWKSIVHRVAKSWTWLKQVSTYTYVQFFQHHILKVVSLFLLNSLHIFAQNQLSIYAGGYFWILFFPILFYPFTHSTLFLWT